MGMLLAADDISAGDFVTIHSPEPKVLRNLLHAGHEPPSGPHLMPVIPGVPLRVLEVSLPFVACSVIEPGRSESGPSIIDLRIVRLCRINRDFVDAIQSFVVNRDETDPNPSIDLF